MIRTERVSLLDYARFYVTLMDGSPVYCESHLSFVRRLEAFAGRTLYVTDLTEDLCNEFLAAIRETNSPSTRAWKRKAFLRLWRHAASNPALKQRPRPPEVDLVVRVKVPSKPPRAWSVNQVRQLLATADSLKGYYGRQRNGPLIVRRLYWRSYVLAAWSLGWRGCDLRMLEYSWIPSTGRLAITQVKTGKVIVAQLSDEAMAAIREFWTAGTVDRETKEPIAPPRVRVWPQLGNRSTRGKVAKAFVRKAGLPGGIGRLRHSSGTNVELTNPGQGHHFLGNSVGVFMKHYFDRTLAEDLPRPEPLEFSNDERDEQ